MLQTKSMLSCNLLQHPILSQRRLHIMRMIWYCTHIPIKHLTLANRKAAPALPDFDSAQFQTPTPINPQQNRLLRRKAELGGLFVENMRDFTTLHIILFLYTSSVILNLLHQYKDNKCAVVFSHDTVKTKHSKAFDMRYHLVRDRV